MPKQDADSGVRSLEADVRDAGLSKVNNVVKMLRAMREGSSSGSEEAMAAMHALRRTFSRFLEDGDLRPLPRPTVSELEEAESNDAKKDQLAKRETLRKFRRWLRERYSAYCTILTEWLYHEKDTCQVAALRTLMHLVQRDAMSSELSTDATEGSFGTELYTVLVSALVAQPISGGAEGQLLRTLREEYIESYVDVRYHTLLAVQKVCAAQKGTTRKTDDSEDSDEDDSEDAKKKNGENAKENIFGKIPSDLDRKVLGENVFEILYSTPSEVDPEDMEVEEKFWIQRVPKNPKRELKNQRRAFQAAWLSFLQLGSFTPRLYRRIMVCLPNRVVPYLQDPLLLSDFLTDAYEQRGPTAMLALNSLFQLMMEHHLDYPEFYSKLYRLLDYDTFHAKHRAQFFELLSRVMASTHLASYLVAAFAKKIARLALYAPPSGAMFAVVLIGNLLKRHPTCLSLLHKPTETELKRDRGEEVADDADFDKRGKIDAIKEASLRLALGGKAAKSEDKEDDTGDNDEFTMSKKRKLEQLEKSAKGNASEDPFRLEETDPAKCGAMDSCLWEVEALGKHYCPKVATLVHSIFETELKASMESKKIQPPIPLDEFVAITYKSLFDQELRKGQKRRAVPLNFVAPGEAAPKPATKMIDDDDSDDNEEGSGSSSEDESAEEADTDNLAGAMSNIVAVPVFTLS
mmetsp:Transcript_16291/g.31598  ORF Transcript_16291/g.31598 Transcript_16291/m.31598 type:complete len:688 (+) Transcript_16291:151-2214(+)|eukprot:CAMPEP_0171512184 /NCGR_PEP_ID=MMETSP0959-20130129/1432_1 /TAXON_ID=87120 /ORGANISM="Aurantiochytrium limacinum, Strain ATCCMYA-1381" /LENGTH=687 /DNA_ID=CAMNT_0012049939 /DNA_START=127 /DNA_END=2190 /DNA_ORIENTATION=-